MDFLSKCRKEAKEAAKEVKEAPRKRGSWRNSEDSVAWRRAGYTRTAHGGWREDWHTDG
jgi:hypothetical protein